MVGNRFFYLIFSLFSSFFLLLIGLMSVDYYSGTYEYDLTGMTLFSMIIYSVCFFFPFLILAKAGDESISSLLPFEKVGGRVTALLVLAGVGICMSLNIQTSMMLTIGEIVGIHIPLPESPYENTVSNISASNFLMRLVMLGSFFFQYSQCSCAIGVNISFIVHLNLLLFLCLNL